MKYLKIYPKDTIRKLTSVRKGEIKLGEKTEVVSGDFIKWLQKSDSEFVLFGIPESIGVQANYGVSGCEKMWKEFLPKFLSIQNNEFIDGKKIAIAGEIEVSDIEETAAKSKLTGEKRIEFLRKLTSEIDKRVKPVVAAVISSGKIPLIIGGGHNNAYGNISGASSALKKMISVINIDAHADLRKKEGRHSGNGFTYALAEGFLIKYFVIGLHENYNSEFILGQFRKNKNLGYISFDSYLREEITLKDMSADSIKFAGNDFCGIELDLDSISGFPSSAETESGFTPDEARKILLQLASETRSVYFHLTEGAPLKNKQNPGKFGKLAACFVTDYIKAVSVRKNKTLHR